MTRGPSLINYRFGLNATRHGELFLVTRAETLDLKMDFKEACHSSGSLYHGAEDPRLFWTVSRGCGCGVRTTWTWGWDGDWGELGAEWGWDWDWDSAWEEMERGVSK